MFKVIFYKDSNGNEPVREYLIKLKARSSTSKQDRIQFTKITAYIRSLQEYGTRIGNPTVKHIDGDICELRPLSDRIFFFYWKDETFVLLHYFRKKSQKTPQKEIDKSKHNMSDFIERTS
ncbi:type II toxin-antitoxin system RelE/ParE family toxin [Acetobacterium tundrae]|uniref:Type II toxin-antitoxin system RelE/ParE family toxin n=1 Tax=Acetobacterium tundrae TaxID=132932 RepID=A0ABR6WMN0_9FIRM|nr:type II toxin-antitoxin system RelE/ParE family toxin [Acetobacterium tundrae]MBC3797382.1 type II toxin-antitoxin system RelE/ParE family toxin [Acetobacterium tundrae]